MHIILEVCDVEKLYYYQDIIVFIVLKQRNLKPPTNKRIDDLSKHSEWFLQ